MVSNLQRQMMCEMSVVCGGIENYLSARIEIIIKGCLTFIFPVYAYENILQMVNVPRLHHRRDELCRACFVKMKRCDHTLNALLQNNGRNVPYTLRSCNELLIPRANTNHYKKVFNSVVFGTLS